MLSTRLCNAGTVQMASALSRAYMRSLVSCLVCPSTIGMRGLTTTHSLKPAGSEQQQSAVQTAPEPSVQDTMRLLEAGIGPLSQQPMVSAAGLPHRAAMACITGWLCTQPGHVGASVSSVLHCYSGSSTHVPCMVVIHKLHAFCVLLGTGTSTSAPCISNQRSKWCRQGCSSEALAGTATRPVLCCYSHLTVSRL